MLLQAQREMNIDLTQSFVIGDKYVDIETAHNAGAKGILVLTGFGQQEREKHERHLHQPDLVVQNLIEAVDSILNGVL